MDIINFAIIVSTLINAVLGFILLYHGKSSKVSTIYAINMVAILLWVWGMFFYRMSGPEDILMWTKVLYIAASFIPATLLYFTYFFPKDNNRSYVGAPFFLIGLINVAVIYLVAFTDLIVVDAMVRPDTENMIVFGNLYYLYVVYILTLFLAAFLKLFIKFWKSKDRGEKGQIIYLLIGYFVGANISFATNLLMPWYGIFDYNWVGQLTGIIMVSFALYAILNYKLFDVRVIVAELMTFSLWLFLIMRTILAESAREQVINGVVLAATLVIGFFLIKSVLREVEQRERLEKLTIQLERANERLKELDHLKTEFLSMASHQFRSPLAAIKGYASLILEGTYGQVNPAVREAVDKMFTSTNNLVGVVQDFLDVSRIEQGSMKYNMERLDIKNLLEEVIDGLRPNIEKAGLQINLHALQGPYFVNADKGKFNQVFINLIDNAQKYTKKGSIDIHITKEDDRIRVEVKDTGMGIPKEEIPKLFDKFVRSKGADEVNVKGTGLGLYVVKKIVEAHHGEIWVESPGAGKGSSFFVELAEA